MLNDREWQQTMMIIREHAETTPAELRSMNFGPLEEYGDAPESDWKSWAVIFALLLVGIGSLAGAFVKLWPLFAH